MSTVIKSIEKLRLQKEAMERQLKYSQHISEITSNINVLLGKFSISKNKIAKLSGINPGSFKLKMLKSYKNRNFSIEEINLTISALYKIASEIFDLKQKHELVSSEIEMAIKRNYDGKDRKFAEEFKFTPVKRGIGSIGEIGKPQKFENGMLVNDDYIESNELQKFNVIGNSESEVGNFQGFKIKNENGDEISKEEAEKKLRGEEYSSTILVEKNQQPPIYSESGSEILEVKLIGEIDKVTNRNGLFAMNLENQLKSDSLNSKIGNIIRHGEIVGGALVKPDFSFNIGEKLNNEDIEKKKSEISNFFGLNKGEGWEG